MKKNKKADPEELAALQSRLCEAEETIEAIRSGAVDAIVLSGKMGEQVYTLRGADRPYRLLVESISEGALILSKSGIVLYANQQLANMLDLPLDQIIGAPLLGCIANDSDFLDQIVQHEETEMSRFQSVLTTRSGRQIPIQLSRSIADESGDGSVAIIIMDLTDQKKIEETLRLSGEIMSNMSEGVILVRTSDGSIVYSNPKLDSMFGYAPGELLGQNISVVNAPTAKSPAETAQDVSDILRRNGVWSGEIENRKKNGEVFWCSANVSSFRHSIFGDVWVGVHADITERKRLEDELERHRSNLEDTIKERTAELDHKNITLQELNTTLKVLLKQREEDKEDMEDRFVTNISGLVLPYIGLMRKGHADIGQRTYLDIIEKQLHEITIPLMRNIRQFNLTPTEVKVAMLVRQGKPTKEIADILGTASGSISIHRKNIRKKLGLASQSTNLQSYLESMT